MKNHFKTGAFWAGILFGAAAVVQALLAVTGVGFPAEELNRTVTSILAFLSVSGIITGKIGATEETKGDEPDSTAEKPSTVSGVDAVENVDKAITMQAEKHNKSGKKPKHN